MTAALVASPCRWVDRMQTCGQVSTHCERMLLSGAFIAATMTEGPSRGSFLVPTCEEHRGATIGERLLYADLPRLWWREDLHPNWHWCSDWRYPESAYLSLELTPPAT
jgi:hypothetical protein